MSTRRFLGAMLLLLPSITLAVVSAPSVPDTAAGHALESWLAAFNSGDSVRIETLRIAHLAQRPPAIRPPGFASLLGIAKSIWSLP